MTFKGSQLIGGDGIEFGYLYYLASPSIGSNTFSCSWSGLSSLSAGVTSVTGSYGVGTFASGDGGNSGVSDASVTATLTLATGDMGFYVLANDGYPIETSVTTGTERAESGDPGGYGMVNSCTNTGTGSVTCVWTAKYGKVWIAIPFLGTKPYTPKGYTEILGARINNAIITGQP
jgi:hypothetical protein